MPGVAHQSILSNATATTAERRLALAIALLSAIGFLAMAPFARVPLPRLPAFIAGYQTALAVNDLITAVLLTGQFMQLRSRALLVLAGGYLYTALIMIPHLLTFPGLFAPMGLLGAGPQTTAWLYMFWHAGFPIFVIAYAVLAGRERRVERPVAHPLTSALLGVAAVAAAASVLAALATIGGDHLPEIMAGNGYTPAMKFVISAVLLMSATALFVVWRRRSASLLDLWLQVTLCAWLFDIGLSAVFNAGRYDLGFYAGRLYGLCAASFVLAVLLLQTIGLYGRLIRAQEQAHRSQRLEAIGQLTAGIAHDFNNLLTALMANLYMLESQTVPPGEQRRFVEGAQKAASRAARLTQQLLAIGRRQMLEPQALDINTLLRDRDEAFRSALGGKIQLAMKLEPSLWPCFVDPAQLESALINIILNAREAMPEGGSVLIETRREGRVRSENGQGEEWKPGMYVAVAVTDDGVGMRAGVRERAFEPFFTTKDVGQGSGLGLSQVYGFVKQMGGDASIASEPGRGTTVTLYLPRAAAPPAAPQVAACTA